MMGGSCSTQRRRHHTRHHSDHHTTDGTGNHQQRRRYGGGSSRNRRRAEGRHRSRSFSSAVGRLCGASQDDSSDDESLSAKGVKLPARHSVDAEVPNQSISHFYPTDDNYELDPSDPTKRCPKSLTDLCIDTICRSLPNLEGELPAGLPPDVVDKIVQSLTSHAALNSTTLRTLSKCELGALSLANCRGVSDEWLASLSSSMSLGSSDRTYPNGIDDIQRIRSASAASASSFMSGVPSPFQDISTGSPPMMMDLEEYDDLHTGDYAQSLPLLPQSQEEDADEQNYSNNSMVDCSAGSWESRSTSSFVSASSRPASPLLPSVLPPPEFFSLNYSSPTPSSSLWLHPMRGPPMENGNVQHGTALPLLHQRPTPMNTLYTGHSSYNDETSYDDISFTPSNTISCTASTLTLLDLRGSQRLTDRGLLQLTHTPLSSLEVVKLDNCHGITGKGILAFSRSHNLHTLSLANCRRLTDEAVVNVSHLGASLMALNLDGCRCLTDRSLLALSGLVELRKLDLSQCDLITDNGLESLEDLSLIEELSLGWCRLISDDGLEILSSQPNRSSTLRKLRLARCSITDVGLEYIEKLENLEELDLNGCVSISSSALGETLGMLTHLTSLDVSYCPGILRSSWQGKINALKSLELCYSGVRDSHLSRLRSLPNLEELNLDSCAISDWGIAHLVDNNVTPNLKSLDLADNDINDAAMSKICQFENLVSLSLFYCNITNRGLRYLSSMTKLEVLNLDSRDIGDDGLRYLRNLPLISLDLFSSRVTDLGCAYLSKIKTLTSLELCGGGVADYGCAHLARLENLTSLNLSQNESITNKGAASLAALSNLKALNLSNTCVTSDALKFFGGLLKLQSLALYGCKDMEDDPRLDSLQSELPSLRCLRLNSASNEDGVIDHESEEENNGEGEEDDEEDSDYVEEVQDEDELSNAYEPLNSDDNDSVVSSEESMEHFQDAYNEIQSEEEEEASQIMDYEI